MFKCIWGVGLYMDVCIQTELEAKSHLSALFDQIPPDLSVASVGYFYYN